MNMDFCANKTPVYIIKEGAFGGTCFRDIYSSINGKWYKTSRTEFDELENIDQKYHSLNYYHVSVHKYGVKCRRSLRFLENNARINSVNHSVIF